MDLGGKYICLILTCKRSYYAERRQRYYEQYARIKEHGLVVIFLYGDADLSESELRFEEGQYSLYVPVEDLYKNLTRKMIQAYTYLLSKGVNGILKIDDDVQIRDMSIFSTDFMKADYTGLDMCTVSGGESWPLKTTSDTFFVGEKITYFGGPFYWLSLKGLQQVVRIGAVYPWEDINIGYAIGLDSSLTMYHAMFKQKRQVMWFDEHEE